MDAPLLKLELCAPEAPHTELDVAEVVVPGAAGVFTVYPGHTPLLSNLIPGVLVATTTGGEELHFAVLGGFVEVKPDRVVILASAYEPGDDIDPERAQSALERARALLQKPVEDMNWERAEFALARSLARLHASRKQGYH